MNLEYEKILNNLKKYNQGTLLRFYSELDKQEKETLLSQIENIDFDLMENTYKNSYYNEAEQMDSISPIPFVDINTIDNKGDYINIGLEAIKNNEYAIIMMAGGSGSRLGHDGPKGSYVLEIFGNKKSIFEIFIEQLYEFHTKYNIYISIYFMTGKDNYQSTIDYFKNNNYFNYPEDKINFFTQNDLPILNTEGKCMLEEKGKVLVGSNGNGDLFKSILQSNFLNKIIIQNIKWLFVCGVDNILTSLIDPLFLGLTIYNKQLLASKTIFKNDGNSKDGVFALKNNKPYILNYWDITDEITNMKNDKAQYLYRDINIANHLINISLFEKFAKINLPYHRTYKKYNYIDDNGNVVIPDSPNSFKFETYVFDAFYHNDNMLVLRVNEKESFAPIKNRVGLNSVETAINLYEENNRTDKN